MSELHGRADEPETTLTRVPARDLRRGDVLIPTMRTVVVSASAGVRTPAGKVDVRLRRRDGELEPGWRTFGARTIITVRRPDA
jgi:hypothetical protein